MRITKYGFETTSREVIELDTYGQQPGSGMGLLKLGVIAVGIFSMCTAAYFGIKSLFNKRPNTPNGGNSEKPNPQPIDVPWVEEPSTPIEEQRKIEDQRKNVTPHPLLVTDDTPDEYSAEDYDDVEDGGVAEIMGDWIHEGDVAIVFAPTGVGKSIFSMQLAMDLAEGVPTKAFPVSAPPKQQHVLYVDFEMMPKEQKQRYGTRLKHLKEQSLGEHMITWHYYGKKVAKETFFDQIAEYVQNIKESSILIVIDNLDKLTAQWGTDAPGYVVDTMFTLMANAARMLAKNVTAIIVGHARKQTRKQKADEIDKDDLFGSSHQRNAGKALIAIEPLDKKDEGYCRLKLIKNRNGKTHSVRAKRITDEDPGNFHFEYLDENTQPAEEEEQLDSASAPSTKTESPYVGFSPHAYGELSATEKMAIYKIVKMEIDRGTKQKEIAERLRALGPVVSEVNVSNIKKDTQGNMPKKLKNNADMAEVNKLRELYFSEYKSIKE